jgi:ABC-type multidrug transport system fused ATPase/permease subunit
VLKDLSLVIQPSSVQALVGGSGSGKSTLAALLLQIYNVDSGRVLVDGYDVRDLDIKWLRSQTGVVEQRPVLFSGTILECVHSLVQSHSSVWHWLALKGCHPIFIWVCVCACRLGGWA